MTKHRTLCGLALLYLIIISASHTYAADNPFQGVWRSAGGTVVRIEGDYGTIIRTTSPDWQDSINQISIKNIRPAGADWVADEWILIDRQHGTWVSVDWRLENGRIVRSYTYEGQAIETYFTRTEAGPTQENARPAFPMAPESTLLPIHAWQLGAALSHITYEEPGIMEEKGFMYGLNAAYTYHHAAMFKAEAGFSFGTVDYTSPDSGEINDIFDYMLEVRGLAGYDFVVSAATVITPYTGLGYRYLCDDSSGKVSNLGAAGYKREANYVYSPVGLAAYTVLNSAWALDALVEYDIFWKGLQKSYLSDANLGYSDIENDQNNGYGLRAALNFSHTSVNTTYTFGPFVRYWDIDTSEVATSYRYGSIPYLFVEPANTSTEYGFNFAILF
jgi:hypothetical protein